METTTQTPNPNILSESLPPAFDTSLSSQFQHNVTNPLMVPVLLVGIPIVNGYMASVEFGKEIWKKITD
jgi:hypothetical protein